MNRKHRLTALRITLALGSLYYVMGAVAHATGQTIFPWFDGALYAPYHDPLIALASLVLAMFLAVIAYHPIRNREMIKVVIAGAVIGSIFSIAIIWKVDFMGLGAPGKESQTIFEGILGFVFAGALLWLYPRK